MSNKILVIDDDKDYIEALKVLLEAKGYEVISALNGETGLETAKKEKPGIILLDVIMSTKNEGITVAQKIKKDDDLNQIPVVLVTGLKNKMTLPFNIEPDDEWLPVKEVLEKPVRPDLLLDIIENNIK